MAASDELTPDLEVPTVEDADFPPTQHLERLYAEIKGRLDTQRLELDDLQRILAIVLAASGVVLGFAGTQLPKPHGGHVELGLLIASVVILAFAICAGVAALWPRAVKIVPEPEALNDYMGQPTNVMVYDLIRSALDAFGENEALGTRRWRSRLVRCQLVLLALGSVLLGAGVLAPHFPS